MGRGFEAPRRLAGARSLGDCPHLGRAPASADHRRQRRYVIVPLARRPSARRTLTVTVVRRDRRATLSGLLARCAPLVRCVWPSARTVTRETPRAPLRSRTRTWVSLTQRCEEVVTIVSA